jgi:hypothetical protein
MVFSGDRPDVSGLRSLRAHKSTQAEDEAADAHSVFPIVRSQRMKGERGGIPPDNAGLISILKTDQETIRNRVEYVNARIAEHTFV